MLIQYFSFWVGEQIQEMFTISHLHSLERKHDFFSRFTKLAVEDLVNYARLLEMKPKRIQFGARHGLMTGIPRSQLSPGVLVKDLRIQRSLGLSPVSLSFTRFMNSSISWGSSRFSQFVRSKVTSLSRDMTDLSTSTKLLQLLRTNTSRLMISEKSGVLLRLEE